VSLGREQIRAFPWATLGRAEAPQDFIKKWREQRARIPLIENPPKISIIIPIVGEVALDKFSLTLDSLMSQSYPHWEAIFVANIASRSFRSLVVAEKDARLRWVDAPGSNSEAALKHEGWDAATGEWRGFMLPEDVLSPVALYRLVLEMRKSPAPDVLYTNEASVDDNLTFSHSFFSKPEYSWFNLIHFNYIGRFWIARATQVDEVGGIRPEVGELHEHELLLRLAERDVTFAAVPYFLYYRRQVRPKKTAVPKSFVDQHLARRDFKATVVVRDGRTKVTPHVRDYSSQLVTVVICFRNQADWTIEALKGICRQAGRAPIEVLLVDNQSEAEESRRVAEAAKSVEQRVKIIPYDGPFNFAHMHNQVIRDHAKGKFILFLNNDVFWAGTHSLDEMVAWASQPWVGTVGICLRYPHGGLQHAGLCAFYGGQARLARIGNQQREDAFTHESHEVFGNTFAACLVRRELFDRLGGLRELEFSNGFGDVIFNFQCLRLGLRNLYLGHIQAVHRESASRGMDYEYWEEFGVEREFPDILQRMLRLDLGYNRVPDSDFPFPTLFREALSRTLTERLPWLTPLKPSIKKWMRRVEKGPS
jgi:GT2 family glycosyltransferase